MYGLSRIIQIDGFIPGIRTVVELDGHSIVNGTNGAGKSSTLKLLSFFYGGDPSQLDSHAAGREPFVQFYLPRQTSLLIFEYTRESGLCCTVAYRNKSGTKHVYRFLEGGFTQERFSHNDAAGQPIYCKGYDLKMHWKQLGLASSSQIEVVTDYRAIIQNDATLINRLADSKALRRMAASYCLGSRKTHMRYIERICAAIVSRSGNMERMKDMLADIMIEDGVAFPESPIHRSDVTLAKEINSLRDFEKEIPHLKEVFKRHEERLEMETLLNEYAGHVLDKESKNGDDIAEKEKEIEGLLGDLGNLESQWGTRYDALSKKHIDARNEENNCEAQIESLDQQHAVYEDQDMAQKAADLDNLNHFIERKTAAEGRYNTLNEDVKAEENALNRGLSAERARYETARNKTQVKLDGEKAAAQTKEREYSEQRESIAKREYAAKEQVRNCATPEREDLIDARATANAQSKNSGRTDEEVLNLKTIENHIDELNRSLSTLRHAAEQKQAVLAKAVRERKESNDTLHRANQTLTQTSDELERLHKLAYAEDGTWLKKLRESDPAWGTHLGKIIDPKLLHRKDLEVVQSGDGLETVFGWSLNLNVIDTPHYAESEDQLRHEYTTQEAAVENAKNAVAGQEKTCAAKNKAYKTADNEHELALRALKQGESQKEQALTHQREQNQMIEAAIAERRIAAKKEAERLTQAIQAFDGALEEQLKKTEDLYAEERNELIGVWGYESSHLEEQIARIETALAELTTHHDARLKEIEADYIKSCSEKGIDQVTLNEARNTLDAAQEKMKSVTDHAGSVNAYREWLKTEWKKRESLISSLTRYKKAHHQVITEIKEETRAHDNEKRKLTKDKAAKEVRLTHLKERRERIKTLKPRLGPYSEPDKPLPPSPPLDLLLQEIESLLENRDNLKETLIADMQGINGKIDQFGDTQIAQAWQRAKDSLRQELQYEDPLDRNFLLNLPQALEKFIDSEVSSIKNAKIESVRGAGKGLTDFFEKLVVVHGRIKKQSKKITSAISENMLIDALSTMELVLDSRVQTLDYWHSLQNFSAAWREWRESGEDGLPSQQFMKEMTVLIDALQSIKSAHHLRDYFDLHIRMVENGHERIIRNDNQLENSTSDGLKYLALCVIFIGISRLLCPDKQVNLHWPIDELGILHGDNISRLFKMLNQGGIVMVGGFPSEDPNMLRHFKHRQVIDIKKGIRVIDIPQSSLKERALARRNGGVSNEHIN